MKSPPQDLAELLARADRLAGLSLAELATEAGWQVPTDFRRDKGWVGQLVEWHLGACAGNRSEADFSALGVELKTLPISLDGQPLESTFVCTAPLLPEPGTRFEDSVVWHKLQRVLWVPVEGDRAIPPPERRLGTPFLWRPSPEERALLQRDWEESLELICLGLVGQISARQGEALQLRPKAAHGRVRAEAIGPDGQRQSVNPRGFYLRPNFTAGLLARFFQL